MKELLRSRLQLQGLETPAFKTPADMVRYFGAVQAQDFFGSLWAVGQRMDNSSEATVEAALNDGSIVRSWPLRGTIHLSAPEDLRWMLNVSAPRAFIKGRPYQLEVGLTDKDFMKSRSILEKELQGKILDRNEIYQILEDNKIKTSNSRGLHILGHLSLEKVLCFGPRKGKQPTFVLLDEWVKKKKDLSHDEALAELALRYFTSHGPATVHDFAWWTGITVTEASKGLDMIQSRLKQSENYWMNKGKIDQSKKINVKLLPAYDEFLVAYKERDDMNVIFGPTVIVNGRVVGSWKRTISKKGVKIDTTLDEKITKQADASLQKQLKRYADFIGYIRL